MSILKYTGWRWVGRVFGALLTLLLLVLFVVWIFALIAAAIGAFFEGVGAAPGLAAAGDVLFVTVMVVLYAIIFLLVVYIILVPLDALINTIWRLIFGGEGSFSEDVSRGWEGFSEGALEGFVYVVRGLAEYAKRYTILDKIPIIRDIINYLIALGPRPAPTTAPCPSQTQIGQLARSYTETQRDYPFGMTGAQVQAEAIRIAEATVQDRLRAEIQAQIDAITCTPPCMKSVVSFDVQLDSATQVVVSPGTVWDTYEATARANGTAVVQCA